MSNTLIVIPARGGSKGIPRKNLRPLAGKPLIYYSIQASLSALSNARVVVTTDDEEIALFAERFGADVLMRPENLADDITTLDPVILHAVESYEQKHALTVDLVLTVQPTSPLVTASDIDQALSLFEDNAVDSVISVVEDRHLCWTVDDGEVRPVYEARVNRQQLPVNFKETGAIIACRREQLNCGTRIGQNVSLYHIPYERSFDIDVLSDFYLCESILNHHRIVFTVVGYAKVGLGHAFRTVMLANELVKYDIQFVCEAESDLAIQYIQEHNYPVHICKNGEMAKAVIDLQPKLVINDILDTEAAYIQALKQRGLLVVNFEDMGDGHDHADLVVNALYPHQIPSQHVLVGPRYFCLRDEFIQLPHKTDTQRIERVLVTFGGVDEGNLTARTLGEIVSYCADNAIDVDVVLGPGYQHYDSLTALVDAFNERINLVTHTKRISNYMCRADLAITSGGRTVLELLSLEVPTIVICQNKREMTHTFASSDQGVINLGYRGDVQDGEIVKTLELVASDRSMRQTMKNKAQDIDLSEGKNRVIQAITALFQR